jgi:hypothetical protein
MPLVLSLGRRYCIFIPARISVHAATGEKLLFSNIFSVRERLLFI